MTAASKPCFRMYTHSQQFAEFLITSDYEGVGYLVRAVDFKLENQRQLPYVNCLTSTGHDESGTCDAMLRARQNGRVAGMTWVARITICIYSQKF